MIVPESSLHCFDKSSTYDVKLMAVRSAPNALVIYAVVHNAALYYSREFIYHRNMFAHGFVVWCDIVTHNKGRRVGSVLQTL